MEQAKQLMSEVANPKKNITLYINDAPGHREIAVAIQAAWKELGITTHDQAAGVRRSTWSSSARPRTRTSTSTGSAGSATSSTRSTSSTSGRASRGTTTRTTATRTTTPRSQKAKNTLDNDARYELYGEAEDILFGENGEMPVMPIYWYTYPNLEKRVDQGHVQRQPAQPDRPDQGRRHRVDELASRGADGALAAPSSFGNTSDQGREARCSSSSSGASSGRSRFCSPSSS